METQPVEDAGLRAFVVAARGHGAQDEFLFKLLRAAGWPERKLYATFASVYEQSTGITLPARLGGYEYARDAFLYLLAFISLGSWTLAVGHLFYVLIDRRFPADASLYTGPVPFYEVVSSEIAAIVIAFPIFAIVSRMIANRLRTNENAVDSGVRAWVTYLALVIAAAILIADAVIFVAAFVRGDLTIRFVLQSLVLIVLGAGVFIYYARTVRVPSALYDRVFGWIAVAVVVISLVSGLSGIANGPTPSTSPVSRGTDRP